MSTKTSPLKILCIICLSYLSLLLSTANAQVILNGDLDGPVSALPFPPQVPPNWIPLDSPDTFDDTTTFNDLNFSTSPNGGTFVQGLGIEPAGIMEGMRTAAPVEGFTAGRRYTLTFFQTISNLTTNGGDPGVPGFWEIDFGGFLVETSPVMAVPVLGQEAEWQEIVINFIAPAVSFDITFLSNAAENGVTSLGIDGIVVTETVPEPSRTLLMGLALLGLSSRRKRQANIQI